MMRRCIWLLFSVGTLFMTACGGGESGQTNVNQPPVSTPVVVTPTFNVTTQVNGQGVILPASARIESGQIGKFSLTIPEGYSLVNISGCGGRLEGSEYVTEAVTADCVIELVTAINEYRVALMSSSGGRVYPEEIFVEHGNTFEIDIDLQREFGFSFKDVEGCPGAFDQFAQTFKGEGLYSECVLTFTFERIEYDDRQDAFKFLTQTTFGPREMDVTTFLAMGSTTSERIERWIDQQIMAPRSSVYDALLELYASKPFPNFFDLPVQHASTERWLDIVLHGPDQLRQRIAYALSQIMVVSILPLGVPDAAGAVHYFDMLASHAFGNYRDLLYDVSRHPAMGTYLSSAGNRRAEPGTNLRPDENYAREMMQLFSIGLVQLNLDGTPVLGADGVPLPTYNQETIGGFARVFTGWSWACDQCDMSWAGAEQRVTPDSNQSRPMQLYPNYHETGEKQLLVYPGVTLPNGIIPSGLSGYESLDLAIDNVFYHPNVPPFISKQLIQKLVTSNPTPSYVERVSRVFLDDGNGVRGNLDAVVRAILLDPEARGAPQTPASGKLKEPLLRLLQLWRVYEAYVPDGEITFSTLCCFTDGGAVEALFGQGVLTSPSVFNYFSPFHMPSGEFTQQGLVSPEMQLATENTHAGQAWYFMVQTHYRNSFREGWQGNESVYIRIDDEMALAGDADALIDRVGEKLLGSQGRISPELRFAIRNQLEEYHLVVGRNDEDWARAGRAAEAIYFVLMSPEYMVQ